MAGEPEFTPSTKTHSAFLAFLAPPHRILIPTPSGASGADGEVRGQGGGCFRKIPWRAPSPGSLAEDQRGSFIIPRESSVLYAMYLLNNTVTSPIHFNFLPLFFLCENCNLSKNKGTSWRRSYRSQSRSFPVTHSRCHYRSVGGRGATPAASTAHRRGTAHLDLARAAVG